MCRNCADCFIGTQGSDRSRHAWRQAYRSVEHGYAKGQCKNKTVLSQFPKDVEDFANLFYELQVARHNADYDPEVRYTRTDVDAAEAAIKAFRDVPITDRRAFAAWIGIKDRKS